MLDTQDLYADGSTSASLAKHIKIKTHHDKVGKQFLVLPNRRLQKKIKMNKH